MRKYFIPFILLLFFGFQTYAQSGNYWSQQYGTRSMLLGGSVIGGVNDLGAVFYNPARLGLIDNPAFILSGNVYQFTSIKFENAVGTNNSIKSSKFNGVPSLAAGSFTLGFLPNHNFAYAALSRQNAGVSFNYREENIGDVITSWPGNEIFEGQMSLNTNIKEDWFGFSWSHARNEKLSFGGSMFLVVNSDDKGNEIGLRALTDQVRVAAYNFNREFGYSSYGLIWKLATAFEMGNWDLGVTITTPLINISGKGAYNYQLYYSGIEGLTQGNDIYANSYQDDLEVNTKRPMAIGAGGTYKFKNSKLHISAEYYGKVSTYTVISAADHTMQSKPDSTITFNLKDGRKSVLNAGIGYEWKIGNSIAGFASFSTDYSAVQGDFSSFFENKGDINNSTIKANFYHIGLGLVMDLKGADITVGATRTGTKQDIPRPVNFPEEGDDIGDIFDPSNKSTLKFSRWQFVFSLSIPFLKDLGKKLDTPDNP